ncbi:alpha/beta fold hydrolase [Treponema sp. OMZ 840]|uniref:alpha/beta hydrolase n=1 Tax=Treponema sp. OMZ 840 TaxID=244313 RepID=UPI003D949D06
MLFVFVCLLAASGFVFFCFAAGSVLFRFCCVRAVYTKNSFVDRAPHVKDERIITPLLEAKNRFFERKSEKVSIFSAKRRCFFVIPLKRVKLCGDLWLQPPGENKNTDIALLVHGFSDSASGMSYLAESYYKRGFSVLSIDLRAHGESGGRFAGLGGLTTDAADTALWLRYLCRRFGSSLRIVLHGVSMGAASVVNCAFGIVAVREEYEAERRALKVVAADCGFFSFSEQAEHQLALFLSSGSLQKAVFKCVAAAASCINFFVNGFLFSAHCPARILRRSAETLHKRQGLAQKSAQASAQSFYLIVFHGTADTLVPPSASRRLYEAAGEPKKLVLTEGAPHIGSWFYNTEEYMRSITQAFETEKTNA